MTDSRAVQNRLVTDIEALQSLLHHPGWEIIQAEFRKQLSQAQAGMRKAANPDDLLKHTYTYMALADLPSPDSLVKAWANQLQSFRR